jgi:alpha-N-arabinofuranosidase
MMRARIIAVCVGLCVAAGVSAGREYHVSTQGNDAGDGTASHPLRTISAAVQLAQSGDVILVREGVYRERVDPLRGGQSDQERIVYQAAPGEKVVIKGSEVVKNWQKVENDAWKAYLFQVTAYCS